MADEDGRFHDALREGTRLLHQRRPAEALEHLELAYELDGVSVDASINLAGAYILLNRHKEAVSVLQDASLREADNVAIWINLGAAYLGNPILSTDAQQRSAIGAFERALELDPYAYSVHYNLGLIYRDRKEYVKAVAMFQKALEVNPNDRDARSLLNKLSQLEE